MQPIDYGVQIADPTQAFLGAFKTGAVIQEAGLKQQQQQQALEQQKLIQAGFTKIRSPDATVEDVANLAMILPENQSKALRESFALRSDAQKQNTLNKTGKIVSAFFAGENDIAANFIDQEATAKRNSGDVEGANFLTTFRDITNINPKAAQEFFTAQLLQLPGGDKIVENIIKLKAEQRTEAQAPAELRQKIALADKTVADAEAAVAEKTKKVAEAADTPARLKAEQELRLAQAQEAQVKADFAKRNQQATLDKLAADLGLTNAQRGQALAQTKKLGVDTQTAALQLQALKDSGGVDPDKKFTQEEKIRKEYQARTKVFGELGTTFANIKSSADVKTGPGDIALITGFMKMLDPGSVVRETEFATARDTSGLFEQLLNQSQKLQSGQLFALDSKTRGEYVALAQQYLNSAEKKAKEEKAALNVVVKNYKLNPENVFGPETRTIVVNY